MGAYFTSREAARLVNLTPQRIRAIARSGVIGGSTAGDDEKTRKRARRRFTFADLTLLRAVRKALTQGLRLSQVMRALLHLRGKPKRPSPKFWPSLIASSDGRLLAREGKVFWDVESKQALLFAPQVALSTSSSLSPITTLPHFSRGPSDEDNDAHHDPLGAPKGGVAEADRFFGEARAFEDARPSEAYRLYTQALLCDPEHIESLVNLGCLHLAYDDLLRAESYFRVVLCLDAGHSVAHYHLGRVADARGETKVAIQSYRLALLYRPGYAQARRALQEALQ